MNSTKVRHLAKRKTRMNTNNNKPLPPTSEELAELNLIEISNWDYTDHSEHHLPSVSQPIVIKDSSSSPSKTQIRSRPVPNIIKEHSQSVDLKRVSVTDRWTQSFKAGRKNNSSQFQTEKECVLKRKLPLNLSSYLLLGNQGSKTQLDHEDGTSPTIREQASMYRPKPALNTRTFFYRRGASMSFRGEGGSKKINPQEESYWKIRKI